MFVQVVFLRNSLWQRTRFADGRNSASKNIRIRTTRSCPCACSPCDTIVREFAGHVTVCDEHPSRRLNVMLAFEFFTPPERCKPCTTIWTWSFSTDHTFQWTFSAPAIGVHFLLATTAEIVLSSNSAKYPYPHTVLPARFYVPTPVISRALRPRVAILLCVALRDSVLPVLYG